ncbi:MAG: HAD-IA family hydrolase [Clostridia bacterium]|nr:HAD-IA family hydrolase [Clostridia bacterium]
MSKKYKCIMFDLDGTLLDTIGDIKYNINITMRSFGYPEHTYEETRSFINDGAYKLIERALPEGKRDEQTVREVLEIYLSNYDKNVCTETVAYDGIEELVNKLKNEGCALAVVSNKPERHVKMLCDIFFGEDTFSYISGTGGDKPVKPSKECVEKALCAMGEKSENLIYVGDSHVDVKTAHNAGVPCVGVTWGFHGKDGFRDEICDFYADNADELYRIITGDVNE